MAKKFKKTELGGVIDEEQLPSPEDFEQEDEPEDSQMDRISKELAEVKKVLAEAKQGSLRQVPVQQTRILVLKEFSVNPVTGEYITEYIDSTKNIKYLFITETEALTRILHKLG